MENKTFEKWLEEFYISLNEDGGVPITKDNAETMFERWLEDKDVQEMIDLGELYGKSQYLAGKDEIINKF